MILARKPALAAGLLLAVLCAALLFSAPAAAQENECPVVQDLPNYHSRYLRQMIEANYGDAGATLGSMYMNGLRVPHTPKDPAKALACFRWGAERGSAMCQFSLGEIYLAGRLVPRDLVTAATWVRKSADRNLAFGQASMGWFYEEGFGVVADKVEALKWYKLAERPRDGQVPKISSKSIERISKLEASMTPVEVSEANARAASFVPVPTDPRKISDIITLP